mgnify:FL=1
MLLSREANDQELPQRHQRFYNGEKMKSNNVRKKKTSIGRSKKHTKYGHKGGGAQGSTPSSNYRKRPRGQGK